MAITKALVTDESMAGQYVAMVSCDDTAIIAHGRSRKAVHNEAVAKGVAMPLIVYCPKDRFGHLHAHH